MKQFFAWIEQERARSAALIDALKYYSESKAYNNVVGELLDADRSVAIKAIESYERGEK